jgi:peptidylprolyl isomerase/peptidyl-prolyl cis-trans isomerase B (cyclophilin B)
MRSWILVLFGIIVSGLIISALIYSQKLSVGTNESQNQLTVQTPLSANSESPAEIPPGSPTETSSENPSASIQNVDASPLPSTSPEPTPLSSPSPSAFLHTPDLTTDSAGLSRTTVVINTTQGVIKFKFYPKDAPNTVNRIIELIQKGFYNGLSFHRVISKFIIQGGDPTGSGLGGSGQKLNAEINQRQHVEGTVAMARGPNPNSADSQFYITLRKEPSIDGKFTIFGQVTEGMDVAKKIKAGDKMITVTLE